MHTWTELKAAPPRVLATRLRLFPKALPNYEVSQQDLSFMNAVTGPFFDLGSFVGETQQ